MTTYLPISILVTFLLIIISGVFSLFDSALNLCRKTRLEKESSNRYKAVLKALESPNKLSLSCRLWGNILKVLAAFSSVIIILFIPISYRDKSSIAPFYVYAALSAIILGIIITLLGDSLPKLLSATKPEKIAAFLLPAMKILSLPMMPFIIPAMKFASFFNLKVRPEIDDSNITEEELQDELRNTLIEGEKSGIVESGERGMVEGVFYLGDRPLRAFMTHRSEIQLLDINAPYDEIREKAIEYRKQKCFPVVNASPDEIVGAVYTEDIILDYLRSAPVGLRAIMKKAQFVPETMPAIKAFESFKQGQSNFLFVMDEYGGLAGLISITTLVEEIVGELSAPAAKEQPLLRQEDGSFLADGTLNIDDAAKELGLTGFDEEKDFHTLAGLILNLAGELPHVGDSFNYQGYKFKVIDKDGNRIDKILITKLNT
ncbi:hemolysin family protein [Treponema sp. R80B11-R83G3]